MKKEPVVIKELSAAKRENNFSEVVLGYDEADAVEEAKRCIQCKDPKCSQGCPVGIDIKKFLFQVSQNDYQGALTTIRENNNFPSVCGRVCPAEYQCRKACVFTKKDSPFASDQAININFIERFVGDWGMRNAVVSSQQSVVSSKNNDKKVAVVGSGPAGLCTAGELARAGIKVKLFESLHKLGGVLRYGIPTFRLPRDIMDFEIEQLKKLGVEMVPNFVVGKAASVQDLFDEGYGSVFLGLGAGVPTFMGIKGESLCNIYSANEFLTRVNLLGADKFPQNHTPVNIGKNIIIIGGGNTAMDSARVAIRLQRMNGIAPNTTVCYRRTELEMPARRLEIHHAKEEGIIFKFLAQPEELLGDENGYVKTLRCLQCELGEPDQNGRRRPVIMPGSEFDLPCDQLVIAAGLGANQVLTSVTPELKLDKWGDVIVDKETMETSMKKVFAGGDIVGGEGTVIEAMRMGKFAAKAIVEQLSVK
ncbi:MAG: NADPH-dependent glutamate synthase [Candidatus Margulisiibacteriota bacterium]|jgi:glutamate synthase (NADPH/NADH) small chain